ncbi:hypothetical protein OCOJLMKI_4213 [Methylobacterium iners]|uniref:Uncharacterized protein n=1 Tax=Methylobacterium iners TaxID=418707 RepID=A0ABQ4S2Y6_9HYPH|nr:hypothetical protein OCOJLMKI_4213 [Methylobacterium iners]
MTTHAYASAIPVARPLSPPRRSRTPWAPAAEGPYKLPRGVEERLTAALAGFRNRDAAFRLAVFLGRYWSTPLRLVDAFMIDRRALAGHASLGLSEARVRGAIATLEEVAFLDREEPLAGKRYRRTDEGLHRRPIPFRFGSEYGAAFAKANGRALEARSGHLASRWPLSPAAAIRPSAAVLSEKIKVAQIQIPGGSLLDMGDQPRGEPESALEAALARLKAGLGL